MGAQMTGLPHQNYDALTEISARTYGGKYAHSLKRVRCTHWNKYTYPLKPKRDCAKFVLHSPCIVFRSL